MPEMPEQRNVVEEKTRKLVEFYENNMKKVADILEQVNNILEETWGPNSPVVVVSKVVVGATLQLISLPNWVYNYFAAGNIIQK